MRALETSRIYVLSKKNRKRKEYADSSSLCCDIPGKAINMIAQEMKPESCANHQTQIICHLSYYLALKVGKNRIKKKITNNQETDFLCTLAWILSLLSVPWPEYWTLFLYLSLNIVFSVLWPEYGVCLCTLAWILSCVSVFWPKYRALLLWPGQWALFLHTGWIWNLVSTRWPDNTVSLVLNPFVIFIMCETDLQKQVCLWYNKVKKYCLLL